MKGWHSLLSDVVLIVLIMGGTLMGRNDLVTEREAIKGCLVAGGQQMQRRNDLIPNLVATVKGNRDPRAEVIDSVTKARAQMAGAQDPGGQDRGKRAGASALSRLMVVVENYPQHQGQREFSTPAGGTGGAENRIAMERREYNETVQKYNTDIAIFPKNIAASYVWIPSRGRLFQSGRPKPSKSPR